MTPCEAVLNGKAIHDCSQNVEWPTFHLHVTCTEQGRANDRARPLRPSHDIDIDAFTQPVSVKDAANSNARKTVQAAYLCLRPDDASFAIRFNLTVVFVDGELRCSLRDKGMIQAARFSWERTAHETWDLYEQVLQGE